MQPAKSDDRAVIAGRPMPRDADDALRILGQRNNISRYASTKVCMRRQTGSVREAPAFGNMGWQGWLVELPACEHAIHLSNKKLSYVWRQPKLTPW